MGCREGFKEFGNSCKRIKTYKPAKTRRGFDSALTWISISGFLILLFDKFGWYDLNPYGASVILIIAGLGLLEEGRARDFYKWAKDGIQGIEYAHILTLLIGFGALASGILVLPFFNMSGYVIDAYTGIVAGFAIVIILLQKYVID